MADDSANEDSWLYGESNTDSQEPQPENNADQTEQEPETKDEPAEESQTAAAVDEHFEDQEPVDQRENENGEDNESKQDSNENGDSDSESDDDINVVIGDIKSAPSYSGINLKQRTPLLAAGVPNAEKPKQVQGKFNIEEFEQVGTINGVQVHEFSIDSLEDKPWRKPGADVTDYFNYGFNEDTWRAYCERQKRMRIHESGTGLLVLGNASTGSRVVTALSNENSKYTGAPVGIRKAGPPPGRRMTGSIDVIGGTGLASRRGNEAESSGLPTTPGGTTPSIAGTNENVIQVMTADRREYSRGSKVFPDTTLPPPQMPGQQFPPPHMAEPYYEPEPYFNAYEPTQDLQWGDPNWAPSDHMKQLTPGMNMVPMGPPPMAGGPPPPMVGPPPRMPPPMGGPPPPMMMNMPPHMAGARPPARATSPNSDDRERDHERERSRDRDRERITRERERDMRERDREMRERDRDRDRERERDRDTRERETRERDELEHSPSRDREDSRGRSHRERSHRRERSRSRLRRHKSHSRSPSHRSHRKKKSTHRKDKEDSE